MPSGIVSQIWQAVVHRCLVWQAQYSTTTSGVTTIGVLLQTGTSTSGPLGEISVIAAVYAVHHPHA